MNRKLGRPPDTSSEETRGRILEAARVCFAQNGFEGTTNRQLAEAARLTTGAIYHYFGSKRELYVEAHDQVQRIVYDRFVRAAEAVEPRFVARLNAVLDEALVLQREDPSLAHFLVTVRTDANRVDELRDDERLRPSRRSGFFGGLVQLGIETGEVNPDDAEVLYDVINAVLLGLTAASMGEPQTHARAIEGVKRLITSRLVHPA